MRVTRKFRTEGSRKLGSTNVRSLIAICIFVVWLFQLHPVVSEGELGRLVASPYQVIAEATGQRILGNIVFMNDAILKKSWMKAQVDSCQVALMACKIK